jgi:hypothetical protein
MKLHVETASHRPHSWSRGGRPEVRQHWSFVSKGVDTFAKLWALLAPSLRQQFAIAAALQVENQENSSADPNGGLKDYVTHDIDLFRQEVKGGFDCLVTFSAGTAGSLGLHTSVVRLMRVY